MIPINKQNDMERIRNLKFNLPGIELLELLIDLLIQADYFKIYLIINSCAPEPPSKIDKGVVY